MPDPISTITDAITDLKRIRTELRGAGAPKAAAAVARVLKSVEGAQRHAIAHQRYLDPDILAEVQEIRSIIQNRPPLGDGRLPVIVSYPSGPPAYIGHATTESDVHFLAKVEGIEVRHVRAAEIDGSGYFRIEA
jgi:hypothetical protein